MHLSMIRFLPTVLVIVLVGASAAARADDAFGSGVADIARHYRDERPGLRVEACNGLVEDVLRDAGLSLRGNVRSLYAEMKDRGWVHRRKVPNPGDIVFFDRTYDSNRNGRQDDDLSHIAVVIDVDDDGTVHMVHRGSKGIRPLILNLRDPGSRRDADGKVINSWLGQPGYAKEGAKLAGELWRAWATPEGELQRAVAEVRRDSRTRAAAAAMTDGVRQAVRSDGRPPVRRPGVDGPVLPLDDEAFVRIWKGRKVDARHLDGRSCLELWYLRNAIFARHGFAFGAPDGRAAFGAVPAYEASAKVRRDTVGDLLTRRDRHNLDEILLREERCAR
jgi:hypothetical protein